MGQQEVIKAVDDLGFTSLEELKGRLDSTEVVIQRALGKLTKWKEIETVTMTKWQRKVYISEGFLINMRRVVHVRQSRLGND